MIKWIRRTLLGVSVGALVIGLIVAAAAVWLLPHPQFQNWMKRQVSQAVGSSVEFESASLALWPALGVRLHEVRFGEKDEQERSEQAKGEVATVASLSCTLRFDALLDGEFVIDKIFLEQPILLLQRGRDGQWILGGSLPQLVDHARRKGDHDAPAPSVSAHPQPRVFLRDGQVDIQGQRPDGSAASFHIQHLDVDFRLPKHGTPGVLNIVMDELGGGHMSVDATLHSSGPTAQAGGYSIEAEVHGDSLRAGGELLYLLSGLPIRLLDSVQDVEGSVSIDATGGVKGLATVNIPKGSVEGWGIRLSTPARLATSFAVTNGRFSMHGAHLQAPSAGVRQFSSDKTAAVFDWSPPRLDIRQIELETYGGTLQGTGSASFVGKHTFSVELQASELDLRKLGTAASGEEIKTGFKTLSGTTKLQGVWTGPEAWLDTLRGSATVNLAGGEVASSRMIHAIFRAIFGMIPGYSMIARDPGPTKLERMDGSCAIHDARCFTEDLVFVSDSYYADGTGSIGFDSSLDLTTRVVLTEGGMARIYGLASVPFRRTTSPTFAPIPVDISGNIAKMNIAPDVTEISLAPFHSALGIGKDVVGLGTRLGRKAGGIVDLRRKDASEEEEISDVQGDEPAASN